MATSSVANSRAGTCAAEFRALAGKPTPGGAPKQYCYIQAMATGMPLRIPPRQKPETLLRRLEG
jgi:hypothetical protein